jgi:hypothetical protein
MMNVDQKHDKYIKFFPDWEMTRTFLEGERAVREAGTKIAPMFPGEKEESYKERLKYGRLTNGIAKTEEATEGMLFRKPGVMNPKTANEFNTITQNGQPVETTIRKLLKEIIDVSWVGVLIEYPDTGESNLLEREQTDVTATVMTYLAESIHDWDFEVRDNKEVLSWVKLLEYQRKDPEDKFNKESVPVYRYLDLDDDGLYRQRLYNATGEQIEIAPGELVIYPQRNGEFLDYIPFSFGTGQGRNGELKKAAIFDVVTLGRAQWISSVDHRNSLKWAGFNQPVGYGISKEESVISFGEPIFFESPEARLEILTGKSDSALEKELVEIKQDMAVIGANILAPQGRYVQSAETAQIQASGDASILATLSAAGSELITWILQEIGKWKFPTYSDEQIKSDISYSMSTDFFTTRLDAQSQIAAMQQLQAGVWTLDTYINNMKAGEVIDANADNEEYKEQLKKEAGERAELQKAALDNQVGQFFNED